MKTKMNKQSKKTLISALLLLIGLVVIFGVAVLLKTGNFNDQSRASSGTIMLGTLIPANSPLCTKCVQQCPGTDNVLRDCNPMASYGISIDSMCNKEGRVEFCGGVKFCCPSPGARWTKDLTKCPGVTPPVRTPAPYRLLKSGGVCTALVVSKTLADPLVGKSVVATGSLKEPYFYVSQLALNTCVQQCPSADKVLRNCTPPESDGTSNDSLCNAKGRVELCGGAKFCCPEAGAQWTKDLSKCPATPTPTKTPTPTGPKGCNISCTSDDRCGPGFICDPASRRCRNQRCPKMEKCQCDLPTPTPTTPSDNHAPQIITTSLPTGTVGMSYGASIDASDLDSDPLQMTISGLPFGLSKGPCGVPVGGGQITCYISGTPASGGFYSVQVVVTDNRNGIASRTIPLSIVEIETPVTPTP